MDEQGKSGAIGRVDALKEERAGQQASAPIAHYVAEFAAADPAVLAARSGVAYRLAGQPWEQAQPQGGSPLEAMVDAVTSASVATPTAEEALAEAEAPADEGFFDLELLGRPVAVGWPGLTVRYHATGALETDFHLRILVANLLLKGQLVPSTGKLLRYTDVPWGDHYWRAFEGRCIKRLARMFASAADFRAAAERAGGIPAGDGDASADFAFIAARGVSVVARAIVWEADEEFPPSAQILFSDNVSLAFSAEDLAVVGDCICNLLAR